MEGARARASKRRGSSEGIPNPAAHLHAHPFDLLQRASAAISQPGRRKLSCRDLGFRATALFTGPGSILEASRACSRVNLPTGRS